MEDRERLQIAALANRENLATPGQRVRLNELLDANQALMTDDLLWDDLKRRWS